MARASGSAPRQLSVAAAVLLLGGCAVFQADRQVRTALTLAPGQSLVGEIEFEGGHAGVVHFASGRASTGRHGELELHFLFDPDIRIAFPYSCNPELQEEHPLGYAAWDVSEEGPCSVVVRNAGTRPQTFHWIIHGNADAVARWNAPWSDAAR